MVDRALSSFDAGLASHVKLIPNLDARLVLISPEENVDRYHVLQGLVDTSAGDDPKRCYSYQHWGNTGDRGGQFKVSGPMEQAAAAKILAKAFKEKTGKDWGQMGPGDR
eukprot:CAMPEP_0168437884 /NCGR_PEP_ID=MMETSP0228-20121227/41672_1 /TAXON_ID=133427 /ORGANISM="Protoceratium reticulatum, Strain CCCM 535 (=CCMP 1889)" /LENGTH=108 /DNA_ID=CAMNT_0008452127 /DNA_START=78 /DNA_END=400 /DNA_ORIENTATION=+